MSLSLQELRKGWPRSLSSVAYSCPSESFPIHYVGLAYSPFPVIGWASIVADTSGALLIIALVGELWGFWRYTRGTTDTLTEVSHSG